MALRRFILRPGIDRRPSQAAGEGGWWNANRVRFLGGWPEKIGGWAQLSGTQLLGVVRALYAWASPSDGALLAAGSTAQLAVYNDGTVHDVTPLREERSDGTASCDGAQPGFAVIDFPTPHGAAVGDRLTLDTFGPARIPGIVNVGNGFLGPGDFFVLAVLSSTQIRVGMSSPSSITDSGVALPDLKFFLPPGAVDEVGTAGVTARFWSLDAWGDWLLAVPRRGGLYLWTPPDSASPDWALAELVTNATPADGPPSEIGSMVVAMPQRQCILFGCSVEPPAVPSAYFDPLLIRWSDIEDFTTFAASSTNSAGSVRLPGGTEIMGALATQLQILVWTDVALFNMRFIGQPYIYRVDLLGRDCGLIGPKAAVEQGGVIYWMSQGGFFAFRGSVPEPIACPLWDDVWRNLNREQATKCVAGGNSLFNEVWFFYPSAGSDEIDRYVAVNSQDGTWTLGAMPRTAWVDRGVMRRPVAVAPTTPRFLEHEVGVDAEGAALGEWIESGLLDIDDGEWMTYLDRLLPDWRRLVGAVRLTVSAQAYSQGDTITRGPFTVTPDTEQVKVEVRGRQLALRIDGDTVPGGDWRLGALRYDAQPDGKV